MIIKGLIIAASGFLFIFAPGLPMSMLYRKYSEPARSMLVTGIIVWIITQVLAIFAQSMIRPAFPQDLNIINPGNILEYIVSMLGPFIASLFLATGLYIVLRRERSQGPLAMFSVLTLGFGAGLINQVFNGLNLVGSGFRMVLGAATGRELGALAEVEFVNLLLVLSALIIFRIALLIVTALVGVMVGRAVLGERSLFWQAALFAALFHWIVIVIFLRIGGSPGQLIVGQANPVTSIIAILFSIFASFLAYRLLTNQVERLRS